MSITSVRTALIIPFSLLTIVATGPTCRAHARSNALKTPTAIQAKHTDRRKAKPMLEPISDAIFHLGGPVGQRNTAIQRNWMMTAPRSNPAMLQMFRDRDRTPYRDLLPWSGEFAGKYLTSAVECYRLNRDPALAKHLRWFVGELVESQASDGYMGPFAQDKRLYGPGLWDLWGQYHCMLGLFRWYQLTGDKRALAACRRTADLLCDTFLNTKMRVVNAGSEEMNESCIHVLALLYEQTGNQRYLALAHEIEKDFEVPPSGDYIRASLAGKPFYQLPKPRWEGLHAVQGIAELYFITGDEKYRKAFEQMWWTIAEFDRHNTGGFSSGEQAQGNPYHQGAIETCCTIAWMAISIDMLRMTGDSRVADELELSMYNGALGALEPDGRWCTYNTPMNGERKAAIQDIAFQQRPGSPELSCCSVNAPRGLGMLSEWAVMRNAEGLALNYYGAGSIDVTTASGNPVRFTQKTEYPANGHISITVTPARTEQFTLKLRIPGWSRNTRLTLNGSPVEGLKPGSYTAIQRAWRRGDKLELTLDTAPRVWVGEKECANSASIYVGPLLMAYDPRFDEYDPTQLPTIDLKHSPTPDVTWSHVPKPWVLLRFATKQGKPITLCDFANAGMGGNHYVSWLPVDGVTPASFSRDNPWRLVR